jgi:hypothetical protein
MSRRWRLLGLLLLGLAFLSTLALHAYLGTYSRFIADDYCSAGMAKRFGVLRAVWYWYLNWTGRYSASALDAVFGLLGPAVTPFVPAIVLLMWLAVLTWTSGLFFSGQARLRLPESLGLALAALFLTLILSPNVPQSLYWGQGMRSIVPPLILGSVFADLLLLFIRRRRPAGRAALWLVLAFGLAFFMGGLNETFTALELSLLVSALFPILTWKDAASNRSVVAFLVAGVVGAGLAFLVVVSAPGNVFREAFYPPPPGPVGILRIAAAGFADFLGTSFGRLDRLMAVIDALGVSAFLGLQVPLARSRVWVVPAVLAAGLAFAFVCFLPAAYGLSDVPPDRTLMIPAYLLAVALIVSGFLIGGFLDLRSAAGAWRPALEVTLLGVAALGCFTSVFLADRQLLASRQAYVDYAYNWDGVNALILNARNHGQTQVTIRTLPNWADLDEPNDNPKFWVNVCYREYYGIEVLAESQP